jgi:hypothetical protein
MPQDRDGKHAGGSIVDTTRANTSPEQIEKDNEKREREQESERHRKNAREPGD